jgi:hypothetical protein
VVWVLLRCECARRFVLGVIEDEETALIKGAETDDALSGPL